MRRLWSALVLGVVVALSIIALAGCATSRTDSHHAFEQGAVAADQHLASEAGASILRLGGNAVDAAVATSFALSVVRPYSCGIGGGGFMLIHLPDDPTHGFVSTAINYRETAPGACGPEYTENKAEDASTVGGAAVAVPGTVAGLLHALERYGTLDRQTVLAPAIRYAHDGFVVDEHYFASAMDVIEKFESDPTQKERFAFLWTHFLRSGRVAVGDRIPNPQQAVVLKLIAQHGADGFYDGPVAHAIEQAIRDDRGDLSRVDLAAYSVREVAPLIGSFEDKVVLAFPPPSSGGVAILQVMGMLDGALAAELRPPLSGDRTLAQLSADYTHVVAEAAKHAFADRAHFMADPAFAPVPTDALLAPKYIASRRRAISMSSTGDAGSYGMPIGAIEDGGTSHMSVVDQWGGAVACTETINLLFGSKLAVPEYGFMLNNEMDDFLARRGTVNAFGLAQSERNLPEPGKRPLSSMSPTIVLDGPDAQRARPFVIAGASGGPRIISGTLEAILNVLLFESGAGDAVARPRFHHQWQPDILFLEPEMVELESVELSLQARGHTTRRRSEIANVQLIRRSPDGRWDAACDPRKGGRPAGH